MLPPPPRPPLFPYTTLFRSSAAGRVAEDAKGTLCDPSEPLPSPSPSFPAARALIDTGDDSVLVNLLVARSEEHTSELQSRLHLVCRLLLEKKNSRRRAAAPD